MIVIPQITAANALAAFEARYGATRVWKVYRSTSNQQTERYALGLVYAEGLYGFQLPLKCWDIWRVESSRDLYMLRPALRGI